LIISRNRLKKDNLLVTVKRATEHAELLKENLQLKKNCSDRFRMEGIVGKSSKMQEAIGIMKKVSGSPATVLINRGERHRQRAYCTGNPLQQPAQPQSLLLPLNCAAIPENLFESELFGYEPGAFTGASARKIGLFEAANNGTLFLDEIGICRL